MSHAPGRPLIDSMKLLSAAFSASRDGWTQRTDWLNAAEAALNEAVRTGAVRVSVALSPDPLLQRYLSGPPGGRPDGPWSETEQHIIGLLRLGIAQIRALESVGDGRSIAVVCSLMAPLPIALRGGRRRFDPRLFRQSLRRAVLPWDRLLPDFQQLLIDNGAVRAPLPRR